MLTFEQARIAAYQRGWNDAQTNRAAQETSVAYLIGYIDACKTVTK